MQSIKQKVAIASVTIAAAFCGAAAAQDFPTKPIRVISAYPTGTGPDVVARVIGDKLLQYWGQSFIIDARPGGNGVVAIETVKNAAPDGYTLLLAGGGHLVINPTLNRASTYDTERDFTAVALTVKAPSYVVVAANGPYKTMADIIAAARKSPGQLFVGTQYLGSSQHLSGLLIEMLSGTKMQYVSFKENSQIFTALINGDIAWTLTTQASAAAFLQSGRVKLIAHTVKSDPASRLNLPSMEEAGVGTMDLAVWAGLVAPRATPPARIAALNGGINKAIIEPDAQEKFRGLGLGLEAQSAAQFGELIRADLKVYADIIKRGQVTLQ